MRFAVFAIAALVVVVHASPSETTQHWQAHAVKNRFVKTANKAIIYDPFPQFEPALSTSNAGSNDACILAKTKYLGQTEVTCFPGHHVPKLQPHGVIPTPSLDALCNAKAGNSTCGSILLDWTKEVYSSCTLGTTPRLSKTEQMHIHDSLYSEPILASFCSKDSTTKSYCAKMLTEQAAAPGASLSTKRSAYCSDCGKAFYKGYVETEASINTGREAARTKNMVEALCGQNFMS